MEFFLIPLFAIVGVTFGIYKVAGLIFHIRLSWRLLAMLVGFAWLISLVLPAVFYHSAGFVGSVGISLVCAAGFAWVATLYDTKDRMAHLAANVADLSPLQEDSWTPAAEAASPVVQNRPGTAEKPMLNSSALLEDNAGVLLTGPEIFSTVVSEANAAGEKNEESVLGELGESQNFANNANKAEEHAAFAAMLSETINNQEELRQEELRQEELRQEELRQEELRQEELRQEELRQEELRQEELRQEELRQEELRQEELRQEELRQEELRQGELRQEELRQEELRPLSDSLDDLLEFAFEQRTCRNLEGSLAAFRQIRSQYSDSEAVPMVEAELVSTLQSCGDYDAALAELTLALELPRVSRDRRLFQVFEQKRTYLAALQELLREQGKPNLPFEQIPAEWSEWVEWKVSAGAIAQS